MESKNGLKKLILKIDDAAAAKGNAVKSVWQFFKFLVVSCMASIIQLILVNVLYSAMKNFQAPITGFLSKIFTEQTMGEGNVNWGYILPWFLSNLIANIYGYIQNRKTTFKSDSPWWNMMIYIVLLVMLILFNTWLQGLINHQCQKSGIQFLVSMGPTLAALCTGGLQFAILFPLEKFVLLKEKKTDEEK